MVETHSQPLRVIRLAGREEGVKRVVAREDEAGQVGEELASEVEDDKEEVEGDEADEGVGLGDARRLLEVVQGGVLGQLPGVDEVSLLAARPGPRRPRVAWERGAIRIAAGCRSFLTSLSRLPM